MEKQRSIFIDLVKGLSILTLFFLHFEDGCWDYKYNYFLVRSPSFYMVVGWLWGLSSHQRTISEHWQKRRKGLVLPYIWLSLIALVFDVLMILCFDTKGLIFWRDLYKTLCLRGIGTLWFLPALLGGELLFLSLRNMHFVIKWICFLFSIVFICLIKQVSSNLQFDGSINDIINAPLKVVENILYCYVYLSAAYNIAHYLGRRILSFSNEVLFVIGSLLLSGAFYLFNFISITGELAGEVKFIFYNLMVGFGILLFFRSTENLSIWKPLQYIGKNTLNVMFFHYCILFQLAIAIQKHYVGAPYSGPVTLLYFGIALVLQVAIIEFVNRKVPFIVGK